VTAVEMKAAILMHPEVEDVAVIPVILYDSRFLTWLLFPVAYRMISQSGQKTRSPFPGAT
jgi:hypothetical protein